jgi:hypothetical protein
MRRSPPHTKLTGPLLAKDLVRDPPSRSMLIRLASDGRGQEPLPVKAKG